MHAAPGAPLQYELPVGCDLVPLNHYVGRRISLRFTGTMYCIGCGKRTSRSFAQGYCFPCFNQDSPECSPCVIRPDLCRAHEGFGRDMEWERAHHLRDHVVYIAWTGGLKVGVTGAASTSTRWTDQGAARAIRLALTPNRHIAGLLERHLRNKISDRTDWRRMLTGAAEEIPPLLPTKRTLAGWLNPEDLVYLCEDDESESFSYPVDAYPARLRPVNLQVTPCTSGRLCGIRGQYLLFDDGRGLNVRKHQGFCIEFECEDE